MAELRRQVALENLQNQRMDNFDQDVPVEFECCFCTSKVYKIILKSLNNKTYIHKFILIIHILITHTYKNFIYGLIQIADKLKCMKFNRIFYSKNYFQILAYQRLGISIFY